MERPLWKPQFFDRSNSTHRLWRAWLLFSLAFLMGALSATAATFTASLDRSNITLGETATLSLRFDGASPDAPGLPSVSGLQIDYVGPSTQFSFINGRTMSSVTHNYTITPQKAGEFTIPSISAIVGGIRVRSRRYV